MAKKILGLLFMVFFSSQSSLAANFGQLIEAMQNLSAAINNIEIDVHNSIILGEQYYALLNKSLPSFLANLEKVADLPQEIHSLVATINTTMPIVEKCTYILGGCVVLGSLIYATSQLISYCRNSYYRQQSGYIPINDGDLKI